MVRWDPKKGTERRRVDTAMIEVLSQSELDRE